jgi:hypothetical protein
MRFRFWTLLWVMALFASAMAAFSGLGIIYAISVLAVLWFGRNLPTRATWICSLLGTTIIISIVLIAIFSSIESFGHAHCRNNLQVLAIALLQYENRRNELPIAQLQISGNPAHSWRSRIIPDIESTTWWGSLDFTKPWDDPVNMAICQGINLDLYQNPDDHLLGTPLCSYFAVVDPRTAWPPDRPAKFEDIKDGTMNTILLIESPHRNIKWYEPKDLTFDEAVELLTCVPTEENPIGHRFSKGFFYKPSYAIHVVFVDGSIEYVPLPISKELAVAALTAAGNEDIHFLELTGGLAPELDYAKVFSLGSFLAISLLPALRMPPAKLSETVGAVGDQA